ncbi:MAG: leucyl-tRNA--protein transferase, partial [Spirochaetaceae bacterium]|nr:leucyl-tRNA--protein transferase [Spirochaetaceae bacterium]
MDSDDPREIIDEIIATNYPYESCFALCFEKEFLSRLLQEGFLLMSYKDNAAGIYILEARHHSTLNVLFFDAIHIPARVKSLLPKYELRFGVEFDTIIDKCIEKHGDAWLTAPLVNAFKEIRSLGDT